MSKGGIENKKEAYRRAQPIKVDDGTISKNNADKGQTVLMVKTVLIYESGDMGWELGASKTFTMTATITDRADELKDIVERHPKNTRLHPKRRKIAQDELKYKTSDDEVREKVINDLMATDPSIIAVIVDKSKMEKNKRVSYTGTAEELLDEVMRDPEIKAGQGCVIVIFDDQRFMKDEVAVEIAERVAGRHNIKLAEPAKRKRSIETPELQVADFPAGAVGAKYNRDESKDFDRIRSRTKVKQIRLRK